MVKKLLWKVSAVVFSLVIPLFFIVSCGFEGEELNVEESRITIGVITDEDDIIVNGIEYDTDDALITVDGNTGSVDDLKVGMIVKINSNFHGDYSWDATTIVANDEVEGPIVSIISNNTFIVMGQTVIVDDDTVFKRTKGLDDLSVGNVVEVHGFFDHNGSIRASRVEKKADEVQPGEEFEVTGTITDLDVLPGTFTIGDLLVYYTIEQAKLPSGVIQDGDFVEVEGYLFVGTLIATEIVATEIELEDEFDFEDVDMFGIERINKPFKKEPLLFKIQASVSSIDEINNTLSFFNNTVTVLVTDSTKFKVNKGHKGHKCKKGHRLSSFDDIGKGDFLHIGGIQGESNGIDIIASKLKLKKEKKRGKHQHHSMIQGPVGEDTSITIFGVTINIGDKVRFEIEDNPSTFEEFFSIVKTGDIVNAKGPYYEEDDFFKAKKIDITYISESPMAIRNISAGSSDYNSIFISGIEFNSNLYFQGSSVSKILIYEYDGTSISNVTVDELSNYDNSFGSGIVYKSKLYFQGNKGNSGSGNLIYEYDDSSIKNVSVGDSDYNNGFGSGIVYKSKLYFQGIDNTLIFSRIYEYDDSSIKNVSVEDSYYNNGFGSGIVYNPNLYFQGNDDGSNKIYEYDGISIKNVSAEGSDYDNSFGSAIVFVYNSKLYFQGENDEEKKLIYEYDGSSIKNVSAEGSDYDGKFLSSVEYNSKLYFRGENDEEKNIIYEYDGSSIKNVSAEGSDYDNGFVSGIVYNSKLYFRGENDEEKKLIYEYDGSSSTIKNVSAEGSDYDNDFGSGVVYGGDLYFRGRNKGAKNVMYEYDGTSISNVNVGSSDYDNNFVSGIVYNNRLYFQGNDGEKNIMYGFW